MKDSEDDPEYRRLMRRIAAVDVPDYPDWKRGRKWGLVAGIIVALLLLFFLFVGGVFAGFWTLMAKYGWSALGFTFAVFLVFGAIGAFRPQANR